MASSSPISSVDRALRVLLVPLWFASACSSAAGDVSTRTGTELDGGEWAQEPSDDGSALDGAARDDGRDGSTVDARTDAARVDGGHDATASTDANASSDAKASVDASSTDAAGGIDGGAAAKAALLDPARASLSYECGGTPLNLAELLTLFDPGQGTEMIGLAGELSAVKVTRTCASLTGCSPWTPNSIGAESLAFQLSFSGGALGSMVATAYDSYWGHLGSDMVAITSGDVLFVSDPYARPKRVRITHQAGGGICVSAATTVSYFGSPTEYQDFIVGRGVMSASSVARSLPSARPALEGAPALCQGAAASTAQIAAAWFQPGQSTANVQSTRYDVATRTCHPITGCSAWGEQQSVANARDTLPIPIRLNVHGTDIAVELSRGSSYGEYTLNAGYFAGAWKSTAQQVDGVVTSSCVGTRTQLKVGKAAGSEWEQVTVGIGNR